METNTEDRAQTVDQLNSFLRGELSAVETYRQAISSVKTAAYRSTLEQCERSHQTRVDVLSGEVRRRGGQPANSSGVWGTFAKAVEGVAAGVGEKAAISALEQGEDHGRDDYRRDIDKLDTSARVLIEQQILPEQLRTHDSMSSLKKQLS